MSQMLPFWFDLALAYLVYQRESQIPTKTVLETKLPPPNVFSKNIVYMRSN